MLEQEASMEWGFGKIAKEFFKMSSEKQLLKRFLNIYTYKHTKTF